jgi:hypothetical protein
MALVPEFGVAVKVRCHERSENPQRLACGAIARWIRPSGNMFETSFFCEEHRQDGDELLPAAFTFRRVRVAADVLIAAASSDRASSQVEAAQTLAAAIGNVGGVLEVKEILSTVGRWAERRQASRGFGRADVG